jgi:DNA-binding Lrp family transcriptional regulator
MSDAELTEIQRIILNSIQDGFPVESRPYRAIAEKLKKDFGPDFGEEELLREIRTLKDRGYIRRLGAIMNSRPLGYESTLCAARVPPERIDHVAALINSYAQVTHNYVRNGDLNVWFTFCYAGKSELDELLGRLREELGENGVYVLNASKTFKIKAVFDLTRG